MIPSSVSATFFLSNVTDPVIVWDMRSLRKPLFTADLLPNAYPQTNIIFSPDEKTILTGLSVDKKGDQKGEIVVLEREGLAVKRRIAISEGSVIKVGWHTRINQVCNIAFPPTGS